MVAPAILGVAAAVVGLGASFLGKKGPRFYVAWVSRGKGKALVTKQFPDEAAAKSFQVQLSQKRHASIIIVKEGGKPFECRNPVAGRALTPEERVAMKRKWEGRRAGGPAARPFPGEGWAVEWRAPQGQHMAPRRKLFTGADAERAAGEFRQDLTAQQIPSRVVKLQGLYGRHDDFDTLEEQFQTHAAAARGDELPKESEADYRARVGPFPDVPDFRDTTSSHEWHSDVRTREMPPKLYPPVFYGRQAGKNLVDLNPLSLKANTG